MEGGQIGGPTLIGLFGDGGGCFDAGVSAGTSLGQGPASDFHDTVDFFAVDGNVLFKAQTAPSATDAASGFVLVDEFDFGGKGFVDGSRLSLAWLVVGCGAWETEVLAELGHRDGFARRE